MGGTKRGPTFAEIVFAITTDSSLETNVDGSNNYDTFKRIMENSEEEDDEEGEP
jgi:hypothetical protein